MCIRDSGHADQRWSGQRSELLAPGEVLARHERVEQSLQKGERGSILEYAKRDSLAIGGSVLPEDLLTEPLYERALDVGVCGQEVMDDLVARDGRRAVTTEALER